MFERGEFDLVALGRVLLADPYWLEKIEQRRFDELTPYDRATALKQYEHGKSQHCNGMRPSLFNWCSGEGRTP